MSTSTSGITEYARDGLTFDVTDRGDPAAPPVLLLHGFPEDRHSWEPVADRLVDAGLRTLAPDQRGYSPRARPSEPYPQAYTLTELADDAVALLDAAGIEQVHLVGHDWGGALAWTLAGGHPDRVATLTVLSTPHPAALRQAATSAPWQFVHSAYMLFFQLPRIPERVVVRRLEGSLISSGMPRAEAERYAGRMREPGALRGALGWYRAMGHSRGAVHRCRVPATFVWGRHDGFLGRQAA
ncbi:MAG TPA: alpha/beta fold hydrolase, partial [Lapillicoccus sp.]|nr:alpha/beta fold hydrolase [Lapillicoccus sp.]